LSGERDRHRLFSYLEERFGLSERLFDGYHLFKKRKNWWLLKKSGQMERFLHLKVWRVGLKAFQEVGGFIKPTTRMIQLFGARAEKAVLEISEEDLYGLIKEGRINKDMGIDNGYVILSFRGGVLGLGLLIDGRILSQLPKKDVRFLALSQQPGNPEQIVPLEKAGPQ
jgi:NOL1/NOP2/fmu family ribosome biogenesis protein